MNRIILVAVVLLFANLVFAQGYPWPFVWGDPNTYILYDNPYDADGWIYDPNDYSWKHGTENNDGLLTITCDIEMYMSMHLDATDVYFHIADNRTEMNAYVAGWLASNNGQWLFVSSDLGAKDLDHLLYEVDEFGRDINYMNDHGYDTEIDVEWYLKESGDPDWRPGTPSMSGNNEQLWGYTWLLSEGDPCTHYFTIRIRIMPDFHQPDGRYVMDPLITCSPVM
jgi:hypothetical protein